MIQFVYESDRDLFENAMRFAQKQVRKVIEKYPDFYPMYTEGGSWQHEGAAWTHWCDGFFPGMMWLFYRQLGPDKPDSNFWLEQAIRYSKPLEPRKLDGEVHDLGFIFMSTYHRWYQFTRDPAIKEVVLQAGRTLAQRFNEDGQYLRSFVAEDSLFIDIMMNVGIIFYAARETNDKSCATSRSGIASLRGASWCAGMARPRTRASSTCETGEFLRQSTQQGFRGDSCWSRGLGWALFGFSTAYEYSRDPRFLHTAEDCADYYITYTPGRRSPAVGFQCSPGKSLAG